MWDPYSSLAPVMKAHTTSLSAESFVLARGLLKNIETGTKGGGSTILRAFVHSLVHSRSGLVSLSLAESRPSST